jgi:hypothetical protein
MPQTKFRPVGLSCLPPDYSRLTTRIGDDPTHIEIHLNPQSDMPVGWERSTGDKRSEPAGGGRYGPSQSNCRSSTANPQRS